eukprot:evm.model.NODE_6492_length_31877_cov_22.786146.13
MQDVTILSWNVAALRSLAKDKNAVGRSNWLRLKLVELGEPACVCLQETKVPHDMLTEDVAILEGYHAFFSRCQRDAAHGGAYSGVVTYVRKEMRVEAAVAGLICCSYISKRGFNDLPSTGEGKKCPFACADFREAWEAAVCKLDDQRRKDQEREATEATFGCRRTGGEGRGRGGEIGGDTRKRVVVQTGDCNHNEKAGPTSEELVEATSPLDLLRSMDKEGRVVMTDHAAFVLINVYAPFNSRPARARFKKAFNAALTARVQTLSAAGRQVVLCGDLNAVSQALDSVEAPTEEELLASPWVRWIRELLAPPVMVLEEEVDGNEAGRTRDGAEEDQTLRAGPALLVDTFRVLHPKRPNAFTCWNNQTGARQTNFGRRIDYILASAGLCGIGGRAPAIAQLSEAEVRQEVVGSDHCPVTARFTFSISATSLPPTADDEHGGTFTPAFPTSSPFLGSGEEQKVLPPLCTSTFAEFRTKQTGMYAFLGSSTAAFSSLIDQKPRTSYGDKCAAGTRDMAGKAGGKKRAGAPESTTTRPASKLQLTLGHYGISKQIKTTNGRGPDSMAAVTAAAVSMDLTMASSTFSSSSTMAGAVALPLSDPAVEANKRQIFLNAFRPKKEEVPRCSGHGQPMVRRQVKKTESEHCGRYFFCCAWPEGARCKTFLWEDMLAVRAGGKRVRGLLKKG